VRARLIVADRALRAAIAPALAERAGGPLIVLAGCDRVAELRRANPAAAIVVVAIGRAEIAAALDAGADVALAGALRPAELRAHLRALARRGHPVAPPALDRRARTVELEGTALRLGRLEFALLAVLAGEQGRVFTKAELRRACWGAGAPAPPSRALERHAGRLRRRLGPHGAALVTVWGVGYRLDATVARPHEINPRGGAAA